VKVKERKKEVRMERRGDGRKEDRKEKLIYIYIYNAYRIHGRASCHDRVPLSSSEGRFLPTSTVGFPFRSLKEGRKD
jgi:hypothetical protein